MRSRRIRRSRKAVLAAVVVVSGMMLLASAGVAVVPPTVDSYGGNAFAAGVHAIVGSNNDPNFSNGAVGNRYPLTSADQDISPASAATASIDDYGPLVATVAGNDCNNPPPSPLPPQEPQAFAELMPRGHTNQAPYAPRPVPHIPRALATEPVSGPHSSGSGTATAHAEELKAHSDGSVHGTAGCLHGDLERDRAQRDCGGGKWDDHRQDPLARGLRVLRCLRGGGLPAGEQYRRQTIVTAGSGKAKPDATVSPGNVQFCLTPANCQPVALNNNGVTVGPAGCPDSPASAGTGAPPSSKVRTVNP